MSTRPTWNPPSEDSRAAGRRYRIMRRLAARRIVLDEAPRLRVQAIRASFRGNAFIYLSGAAAARQCAAVARAIGADPRPDIAWAKRCMAEARDRVRLWQIAGGRIP